MSLDQVPGWAEIATGCLVLLGSSMALLGSLGVLRLRTFFQRIHATTLGSTMGCWSMATATLVYSSAVEQRPVVHAVLISVFVGITIPVTTIFLMRAALFRKRQAGNQRIPGNLTAPREGGSADDVRH
ncbi:MAG: cation:proton antiporter [Xylophilus ampelinus]